jgi:acetaldehyde dehydrogenase/alcohol dehydrogenase
MTSVKEILEKVRKAQQEFATYPQEKVDDIFKAVAIEANENRIPLAKLAVEETGMGVLEDKVIKNHYASEYIYNRYKDEKTCGVIERDEAGGYTRIAEPIGVIGAIVPTTNPTSTTIFKILLCLKTRNGLIISPHPRAKNCTVETARRLLKVAVEAGAPENIIGWIEEPSVEISAELMKSVDLILATGGPQMVRSAYSSGKPAIGVGAGNTPAVFDETADIPVAVSSVLHSKTFDNGVICASEQAVVVAEGIYDHVRAEFETQGAYFLNEEEKEKLRKTLFPNGVLNAKAVGQTAQTVAKLAGISVAEKIKVLIGEVESADKSEVFAHEKLSPVLAMYKGKTFEDCLEIADKLVQIGGMGHTACVYINENKGAERLRAFSNRMKACRILVNTPASQGGIGDLYNFRLTPSLTLGCGSWGGNSVCENVGVKQLLNVKAVAEKRENMLWLRVPQRVYFKRGCLPFALRELKEVESKKRAFIVTDAFLYEHGVSKKITDELDNLGIEHTEFWEVTPDPTLACVEEGAKRMRAFSPDVIIAVGGGSPMDAGKIMWLLYEHPNVRFSDIAMRFMDIRKRVFDFPKLGEKASFIAVPTTAGTGSEVTPFAVITDEKTGDKYPLADYELLPNVAICDVELMLDIPQKLTAYAGFDALSHAMEAVASIVATDYTNALAIEAIKLLVEYLPRAFEKGREDVIAREKVANGATMAGIAFANAFLGLCHSMAHKLGGYYHLPHGLSNALLLCEVMKFNAEYPPKKMGTFPQYATPEALKRYARVGRELGLAGNTDEELFESLLRKIEELKNCLGLPKTIREALLNKVSKKEFEKSLDKMAEDAFDDQCTGANPRYPLLSEIKNLYLRAYGE